MPGDLFLGLFFFYMFCKYCVKNNKETFTLAFIQSFFVLSAQKGNALILQEQKRPLLQLMHLSNSILYFSRTKKKKKERNDAPLAEPKSCMIAFYIQRLASPTWYADKLQERNPHVMDTKKRFSEEGRVSSV